MTRAAARRCQTRRPGRPAGARGTGTRGTFDVTVKYPSGHAGKGSLIVFENSAKDGSPTNVVEIPIVLK